MLSQPSQREETAPLNLHKGMKTVCVWKINVNPGLGTTLTFVLGFRPQPQRLGTQLWHGSTRYTALVYFCFRPPVPSEVMFPAFSPLSPVQRLVPSEDTECLLTGSEPPSVPGNQVLHWRRCLLLQKVEGKQSTFAFIQMPVFLGPLSPSAEGLQTTPGNSDFLDITPLQQLCCCSVAQSCLDFAAP